MSLAERVRATALSPRERRVADLILSDPSAVAFGTVASVATAADVGNSTVMRFANATGFDGFSDLQQAVRNELDSRLRQATHRVRQPQRGDPIDRSLDAEIANVTDTFARLDRVGLAAAAARIARCARVGVVAGDTARGVAQDFATQLGMVRPHVELVDTGSIALTRSLTWFDRADMLVAIDTARYEHTVTLACERAADRGVPVFAISDSHLSPIAAVATWSFQVLDHGAGPFDSFVGALALTNLLVTLVTKEVGRPAVRHIDRLEAEWNAARILRAED